MSGQTTTAPAPLTRAPWWIDGWNRFRRNGLSVVGLVITLVFLIAGVFAPVIATHGPFELVGTRLAAPSWTYLFGTDQLGRDIFSGVIYGTRTSLEVGLLSTLLSVGVGILVGAPAGFFGGRVDDLLMRFAEIFQVLPRFFLALVIVALFGANLWGTILVIGVLSWSEIARMVRGEFLTRRERPYVMAARAYGAGDMRIMFAEILPNALTAVVVTASLQIPSAIILEASLSFLGAGDPTVMSWGRMLNNAQQFMRQAWWTAAFPGLAISLLAMGMALLADGINDFLNPRLQAKG
ncbi:MAG TPA: ABC transporter permease [Devosiaceae bacterium]|jgi:peptide/nickel transport system permease protein